MKTAKAFKEQWEQINLLRLIYFVQKLHTKINQIVKAVIIIFNVLLFIFYRAGTSLWLIIKLLLMSEPEIKRIERDETWIFRQLK